MPALHFPVSSCLLYGSCVPPPAVAGLLPAYQIAGCRRAQSTALLASEVSPSLWMGILLQALRSAERLLAVGVAAMLGLQ